MPLHVVLDVQDQVRPLVSWDVGEDLLTASIVEPYLRGARIVLSGRILNASAIRRLQIVRTEKPSRDFLPQTTLAAADGRGDWFRPEGGVDVTDAYVRADGQSGSADSTADRRSVWVVYGRDRASRDAMFTFLRAIGLQPLEWQQALLRTATASPFIGQVLDAAFAGAHAVVVLLTGDDVAMLREPLRGRHDGSHETQLTPQARPNVLFEAGMAFGHAPDRTVLVQVGPLRPFSDIAGRHIVHLGNDTATRQDLAQRLKAIGCSVDLTGVDWHNAGNFSEEDLTR